MRTPTILLSIAFVGAIGLVPTGAQTIPLTPERTNQAASLLGSGKVLITGGLNETATLDSALLYDPGAGTIAPTGTMTTPRANQTSTLLPDGDVLITGGDQNGTALQSAELYDPTTGLFAQTFQGMRVPRTKHTATLLPNGQVLLDGGKAADIYDPATQTFTATIGTPLNRNSHSAILLQDGTVLIIGGYIDGIATDEAEIYNPATQQFTVLANRMQVPRANLAAVLMPDGTVLITGGFSGTSPHNETEIYDPVQQTFTIDTPMLYHRSNHQALLQGDGRVVVIGGITLESGFLATDEVYDPTTQMWTSYQSMIEDRAAHTATMLQSGNILVAGGVTGNQTLQSAEILDPITHDFTSIGNMNLPRNEHRATLLNDGTVLITAGSTDTATLKSSELFDPTNNSFTLLPALMIDARKSHTATLLQDGDVLVAGGKSGDTDQAYLKTGSVYDHVLQTFHKTAAMNSKRALHTATLLDSGEVLLVGGVATGGVSLKSAELYNPVAETFVSTGDLFLQRKRHRAALLNDGTVLVMGGDTLPNVQGGGDRETDTAELYNNHTGMFSMEPNMSIARAEHEATILEDGTVLVTGGTVTPVPADLYDPSSSSFSTVGQMVDARGRHIALRLTNPAWGDLVGDVLCIGGSDLGSGVFGGAQVALASVEIYDPVTQQFSLFGNMTVARQNHTATELQDGRILIAGGVGPPSVSATAELLAGPTPSPTPDPSPTPTPAPAVATLKATSIFATGVTFNGTVNPNGSDTTYHFDYGLTDSYGSTTTTTDAGSGTVNLSVSSTVGGLTPNTLYHFRISATSVAGTTNGADFTVTTLPPTPTPTPTPPTVVTLAATSITMTGATLNGTVNPRGSDTTFHFDYGLTDSYGSTTTATDLGSGTAVIKVASPVSGLVSGTLYHFRISATNPAGTTNGTDFTVTTAMSTPTPTPTPAESKPLNISTRVDAQTGDEVLIGGFIITGGTTPKKVIIRAIGPSLGNANPPVAGAMADPVLELHEPDGTVVTNDNWKDNQESEIEATGVAPTNDLESAIVATLPPYNPAVPGSGAYTAIVSGKNNTTGVALVEVYDLDDPSVPTLLANISTRGLVQTGDNAMIGGFIIGSGANQGQVLVRAIGPSLAGMDVSDPLEDPNLTLYNDQGIAIATNDNWQTDQESEIAATGLAPTDTRESAILSTLPAGAFTAIVRGNNNTTGVALVEVYYIQ